MKHARLALVHSQSPYAGMFVTEAAFFRGEKRDGETARLASMSEVRRALDIAFDDRLPTMSFSRRFVLE